MSLFDQHILPTQYSKSYSSEKAAVKAASTIINKIQKHHEAGYRNAQFVVTKNSDDRFCPVIISQNCDAVFYAHSSFATIGV
tara:strand:- start:230 stop:475 length:246 start_codon:yes stop_codon:yes gene_type:complete